MNDRITLDPAIHHGRPTIRGTQVPAARLLAELADGVDESTILSEYGVTREDLFATYRYAADLLDQERARLPSA